MREAVSPMRSERHTARARMPIAVVVGLVCGGCIPTVPGGPPRAPHRTVPDTFGAPAEATSSARVDWRTLFPDPRLTALIDVALQNNQELNIAVQEILVLNNEVMARRGEYIPSLAFGAGAGLERAGRYTSQGQADERSGLPADLQRYSLGLYAQWEVDVFGRLRDAAGAAQLRLLASREGRSFMVTRLVAEIASGYYELLALDRRLEIVRNSIELQQSSLDAMRLQQQAARVTMLAVRRFEAQLYAFHSRQFEVTQRIVEVENHLNFLLGRFPQHIARDATGFVDLEPAVVHTGVPADLLENRPDVRRAELELAACALDVSSARARFYPALRLDASVGVQSYDLTRLVTTPDSILYGIFANVMAPLLNRAGITAQYFSANSRQMQAVVNYERAILTAYLEVNTAMNLLRNLTESFGLRRQQVQALTEAVDISMQLFSAARADYLEVLTTRRDSLEAQFDLVENKLRQMTAAVTLYQALGGGWRAPGADTARDTQGARDGGTR
jgi:outer membrane protein, multidrug efflux system